MDFEGLRRRSYLGGTVAALTGLAGCSDGATTERTDTEETDATTTGATTDEATVDEPAETTSDVEEPSSDGAVVEHDHSGAEAGGSALAPESVRASTVTSDRVEAGTLTATRTPNGRLVAPPGELQATLDAAEEGDVVELQPARYQPGEAVTVPKRVTVEFNGGYIEVDGDHDVLFVDNGSKLVSPRVVVPPDVSYSSTVVHYDTTRSTGSAQNGTYDPNYDQHVDVEDLRIEASRYPDADQSESVGVHLDARGSYLLYNHISGRIGGLGTQVLGTTTSEVVVDQEPNPQRGYVNGNVLELELRGAQDTHVRHAGDHVMRSRVEGMIQPTTNVTDYGLVNETNGKSMHFNGVFWDPQSMNEAATRGPNITMILQNDFPIPSEYFQTGETRETTYQTGLTHPDGWLVRNGDGNTVSMRPDDNRSRLYTDQSESLHLFDSGGVSPPPQDLSALPEGERDHGAMYRHDGSGDVETSDGATSAPGYYVWNRNDWVFESLVTF